MLNIRHTGIVVSDIEKSIDFYEKLGFEIQKDMLESGDYIDNFSDLKDVRVRTVKMSLENGDMIELLWYKSWCRVQQCSAIFPRWICQSYFL